MKHSVRNWHIWVNVALGIPLLLVGLTTFFIAHEKALGTKEIIVPAGWLGDSPVAKPPEIRSSAQVGTERWVGTKRGLYRIEGSAAVPLEGAPKDEIRGMALAGSAVLLAGKKGVWRYENGKATRTYAGDYRYELTVRREEDGKLSRLLAEHARPGTSLLVTRPSGDFVLAEGKRARRAVMIAGGVGITPLLAMIDEWRHRDPGFGEVHLYWQVRYESELIYRNALERHANEDARLHVKWLVSRPRQGAPQRISIEILKRELGDLAGTQYFLCAGQSLLDSLVSGLIQEDVCQDAIRYERFGLLPLGDIQEQWELNYGGQRILFSGHASILDALEEGGVPVAADCRTGTCGRCCLAVLSGEARHFVRPQFAVSAGNILACCSVPVTNLVIAQRGLQAG